MKRTAVALFAALLAAGLTACASAAPVRRADVPPRPSVTPARPDDAQVGQAAKSCSTRWGTGKRNAGSMVQTRVRDVRVGQHACFDRLVVDLGAGKAPGYTLRYVGAFHADGSGALVPVSGHAKLLVTIEAPAAASFPASRRQLASVAGFAEFRQVAGLGSFEGVTSLGLGLAAKKPFRVFEFVTAAHKYELVVDVAR
jgi:hypothetical protein